MYSNERLPEFHESERSGASVVVVGALHFLYGSMAALEKDVDVPEKLTHEQCVLLGYRIFIHRGSMMPRGCPPLCRIFCRHTLVVTCVEPLSTKGKRATKGNCISKGFEPVPPP